MNSLKLWQLASKAEEAKKNDLAKVAQEKQIKIETLRRHVQALSSSLATYAAANQSMKEQTELLRNSFKFQEAIRKSIEALTSDLRNEENQLAQIQQLWMGALRRENGYVSMADRAKKNIQQANREKEEKQTEDIIQSRIAATHSHMKQP